MVFQDETGFTLHPRLGFGWARRGQRLRVATTSQHHTRLNLSGWVAPLLGRHSMIRTEHGNREGCLSVRMPPREAARMLVGALEGEMLLARAYGDPARFASAAKLLLAQLQVSRERGRVAGGAGTRPRPLQRVRPARANLARAPRTKSR